MKVLSSSFSKTKPSWPGLLFFLNSPPTTVLLGVAVLSACANAIRNTTDLTQLKSHLFTYSGIAGGLASCLFFTPTSLVPVPNQAVHNRPADASEAGFGDFLRADTMARLGKESLCVVP